MQVDLFHFQLKDERFCYSISFDLPAALCSFAAN